MKFFLIILLSVGVLTSCSSPQENVNTDVSPPNGAEIPPSLATPTQKPRVDPPKVIYETIFDQPFEDMEDDTISTFRTKILNIETVDQDDLENSIIAGMKLAYNLYVENPEGKEVGGIGLTKNDTRVFRYISDNEKQLSTLADLKVGQEIEVQYFYPTTPLFLATEIVILNEP